MSAAPTAARKRPVQAKNEKNGSEDADTRFDAAIEAVLFSADRAVSAGKIAEAITQSEVVEGRADGSIAVIDEAGVKAAVERLNAEYERTGRAFAVEAVAGGYRVMTRPEHAAAVAAFQGARASTTLSRAAMETLAIVAYKQPITRAQLEAVRGVACGEVLRSLIDRKLITITGRAEELGRPMLYGTTKRFLEIFGLASLKELPDVDEFRKRAAEAEAAREAQEAELARQRAEEAAEAEIEARMEAETAESGARGTAIGTATPGGNKSAEADVESGEVDEPDEGVSPSADEADRVGD